jgi:hypothetical protein
MRKKWGFRFEGGRGGFEPGKARKVFTSLENLFGPSPRKIWRDIAGAMASRD